MIVENGRDRLISITAANASNDRFSITKFADTYYYYYSFDHKGSFYRATLCQLGIRYGQAPVCLSVFQKPMFYQKGRKLRHAIAEELNLDTKDTDEIPMGQSWYRRQMYVGQENICFSTHHAISWKQYKIRTQVVTMEGHQEAIYPPSNVTLLISLDEPNHRHITPICKLITTHFQHLKSILYFIAFMVLHTDYYHNYHVNHRISIAWFLV